MTCTRKLALFRKSLWTYHSGILQELRNINSVEGLKITQKTLTIILQGEFY